MKKILFFLMTFLLTFTAVAQEKNDTPEQSLPDVQTLFLSYLENDSELKNLSLAAQKAELSDAATIIDNGFDITLSSGTITVRVAEDGNTITAKPSIKASLPSAANLSVNGQTNINSANQGSIVTDTPDSPD